MNLLDEIIKVQEEIQKAYEELTKFPEKEITEGTIRDYRNRLELLRTLREATFLATVVEDDKNRN